MAGKNENCRSYCSSLIWNARHKDTLAATRETKRKRREHMEQRFKNALEIFTAKMKKNPRVIGIVATGSAVHTKPDKNSDLDIFVILDKSTT